MMPPERRLAVIRSNEPQQGTWIMTRKPWKAVILDMDGVITQTARVHARAWKTMFDQSRTSHGSMLSRVVHAWVLARADRQRAWELFREALESDVADIPGGTTSEGIHLGAMAGTVDIIQRCHTGIEMRDGILWLNPCLPEQLEAIRLRLRYRGHWLQLHVSHQKLTIRFERGQSGSARIGFRGQVRTLAPGDGCEFELSSERG
jgi:trehalose/maltose hydrolase-like predicted phosphorylase